jgi:hypothetical protein
VDVKDPEAVDISIAAAWYVCVKQRERERERERERGPSYACCIVM